MSNRQEHTKNKLPQSERDELIQKIVRADIALEYLDLLLCHELPRHQLSEGIRRARRLFRRGISARASRADFEQVIAATIPEADLPDYFAKRFPNGMTDTVLFRHGSGIASAEEFGADGIVSVPYRATADLAEDIVSLVKETKTDED